jgi:hypothetical protein
MLNSQTGQFQRYSPGGQPIYTHHANPISKINLPRYDEPHLNHHLIGILMKKPALLLALCLLFGISLPPKHFNSVRRLRASPSAYTSNATPAAGRPEAT